MTARLRELAERWRMQSGSMASAAYEACANELLSILDDEGDGGAAGNADVMVCQIGDYAELDKRAWATVIYDDKKVAECYTNEDAELVGAALRVYSTHPARSGGVSDADAEECADIRLNAMKDGLTPAQAMRAALTHFAKGSEVGGDAARMDWLVSHDVEVRDPRLHGSVHLFTAQTTSDEEDDFYRTSLREQIDAARKGERHDRRRRSPKP